MIEENKVKVEGQEKQLNELLVEVIHIACQAELAADEHVKRQALVDIYDALASVLPVDHRSGRALTPRGTDGGEVAPGRVARPERGEADGNGKKYINLSLPNGFAFAAFVSGHKLAEVGRTIPGGSEAEIYNDGVCELTMRSPRGKAYLYRVVREAMYGVVSRAGKCARYRKNVSAREATPGREGAARTGEEA